MIFYYSCTGNTEWAAKEISAALGEEARPIPTMTCSEVITLKPNETIGFCFPVHAWRPPRPGREFARQCRIEHPEGHYCWMVCTAGDDIGETMDIMQKDIGTVHLHADSVFSLIMPNTYVGLPFMDVDKEALATQKTALAQVKLQQIIHSIQNHEKGLCMLDTSRWPRINSRLLGHLFIEHLMKDDAFVVDSDKCLRCGRCTTSCPVGNIRLDEDHHPRWLHNGKCLTCFACYHHCPADAIQWGKATRGKGKYYFRTVSPSQA